jgi:predicted RNase H-like nuclease
MGVRDPGRQMSVNFIGFDSAWTDNPKMPGAICSLSYDGRRFCKFNGPSLVRFSQALEFIRKIHVSGQLTLIAIDQPTIVEWDRRARCSIRDIVAWRGVQPANRSKVGMFDDGAPIWKFLRDLAASEDPERARPADSGIYVIEVFPALALPAFHDDFCGRLRGPRYNPGAEEKPSVRGIGLKSMKPWPPKLDLLVVDPSMSGARRRRQSAHLKNQIRTS